MPKMIGIFIIAHLFSSSTAMAMIFNSGIRYFDTENEKEDSPDVPKDAGPRPDGASKKKFDWSSHLDVEKDEFFKEGDYIPPAPFMEALRRPTPENILLFEKWQQTKNLLLERYETARRRYLGKTILAAETPQRAVPDESANLEKLRFVFYFDAACPSCKAMFATINQMIEGGIYVEAVRVDKGKDGVSGLSVPWTYVQAKEIEANNLKAVPFLMAFDDKAKKVYRITGRKTIREISQLIGRAGS